MAVNEPTSALTFRDLIIEVAVNIGVADYGANQNQAADIPQDIHDLDICKRVVNNAIRMVLADAPRNGWMWQTPVADIDLWADVATSATQGVAYVNIPADNQTQLTAITAAFFPTMEGHEIVIGIPWVTGVTYVANDIVQEGGVRYSCAVGHVAGTFATDLAAGNWTATGSPVVASYESPTVVRVAGNYAVTPAAAWVAATPYVAGNLVTSGGYRYTCLTAHTSAAAFATDLAAGLWATTDEFSMVSNGRFTLPKTFSGQYEGTLTYASGANHGTPIELTGDMEIRHFQENVSSVTGYPRRAAIRRMPDNPRRWEMVTYPTPHADVIVTLPYELHFNNLVALSDLHPAGFAFDEIILAACLAVAERDVDDTLSGRMSYYQDKALVNAKKINARTFPRRLGNLLGEGRPAFKPHSQRAIVTYTP